MNAISKVLLIIVAVLVVNDLKAADACVDKRIAWSCFGSLELQLPAKGTASTTRMIRYTNGDVMFEIDSASVTKRALLVFPSGLELFSGLNADETGTLGKNPFTFIDQGFGAVLMALQRAFPLGPKSATEESQEVSFTLEPNASVNVSIRRLDAEHIGYRIESTSRKQLATSGVMNERLAPPLSDRYDLTDWTGAETKIADLRTARSYKRPAKPITTH